ncbi:hypothetical protein KY328_03145 [Candidatus Woesearchaeota archaeon]|nr:hypothetical protein [Candidatus Woesearchaeota archaeon]MBW3021889.1 hypothetical protein [Candidatus Woesearchaeota archaeon]
MSQPVQEENEPKYVSKQIVEHSTDSNGNPVLSYRFDGLEFHDNIRILYRNGVNLDGMLAQEHYARLPANERLILLREMRCHLRSLASAYGDKREQILEGLDKKIDQIQTELGVKK